VNRGLAVFLSVMLLGLGCWFGYSKLSSQPALASASLAPKIEGCQLYFVPIGDFPGDQLGALTQYYRQKYNLEVTVLSSIPLDPATRDESRHQLMAEQLATSLRTNAPEHAADPRSVIIGFTSEDIYPTSQNWQFAFGWRLGNSGSAVVSTARMSLEYPGEPPSAKPDIRLRKVVTKDIGILYYGLPQSSNPQSVLYNQIMGIEELDEVGDDF
jgi:predicted Zn-dependent protease